MPKKDALPITDISEFLLYQLGSPASAPDCLDYIGPVVIKRTSDGRGRGLFASKTVRAGEVLLVSNAMAVVPCQQNPLNACPHVLDHVEDLVTDQILSLAMAVQELLDRIVSLAMASREFLCKLYSLAYNSPSQSNMEVPSMGVSESIFEQKMEAGLQIDMGRIWEIVSLNAFGGDTYLGLWWLPSFINHSCLPNANRLHVGDAMFVHASDDIQAGKEITHSYFDALLPLKLREEACQRWGFQCECERCRFEKSLQDSLQEVAQQFESTYKTARKQVWLPQSSCLLFRQPTSSQLFTIYGKLKKIICSLSNVTKLEKQWILAGYSSAFLAKWYIDMNSIEETVSPNSVAVELIEAMKASVPGQFRTLCVASQLSQIAQQHPVEAAFANRLIQQARDECIRVYGRQKDHVLEELIMQHSMRRPGL